MESSNWMGTSPNKEGVSYCRYGGKTLPRAAMTTKTVVLLNNSSSLRSPTHTLKQFRQPEPPINRSTTRTRTRPRTSGPGTRPYSRAYASGPEPDLTPDVRSRRTTESSSSSSSSSSSPSFVVIVVVVSPSHWGAGAAEEAGAEAEAGGGGGGGRLEDQRKTRKTRCSTRSTKVPEGSENPRERGSDLEVGLGPPGGGRLASSGPQRGVPGCTRGQCGGGREGGCAPLQMVAAQQPVKE